MGLTAETSDGFDGFYRREYRAVVGLAFVLCGDRQSAEDLAQEAFASAHTGWARIGCYDNPGAWVRRVVANQSVSLRRRRVAEARALLRLRSRPSEPAVVLSAEDAEVWAAVRKLPRRQAQVVALVYLEDLSISETAAVLGCGEGTVKTHLRRARVSLARRLGTSDVKDVGEDR